MTNKQIRNLFSAFNQGDMPSVLQMIHPQAEWIVHGAPDIIIGGHVHGLENIVAYFQKIVENVEIHVNEPAAFYRSKEHPNTVMIRGRISGLVYKTQKKHNSPFVDLINFNDDGQIVRYERLSNTLEIWKSFSD